MVGFFFLPLTSFRLSTALSVSCSEISIKIGLLCRVEGNMAVIALMSEILITLLFILLVTKAGEGPRNKAI